MIVTAPRATPTPMPVLAPLLRPEDDFEIVAPPVELELLLAPPAVTVTVAGTVPVLVVDMPVLVVSADVVMVDEEGVAVGASPTVVGARVC